MSKLPSRPEPAVPAALDGSAVASLRRLNGSKVLQALRAEPSRRFTVREVATSTGLSRPTVARLLEDLVEAGHVLAVEGRPGGPGGTGSAGRPARRFWFNRWGGLVVSVDLGATSSAVMITDLVGTELHFSHQIGVALPTTEAALEDIVPRIDAALTAVRGGQSGRREALPVAALSVSAPVLTQPDGTIGNAFVVVRDWCGGNLLAPLRRRYGNAPGVAANDLVLAAEAEMRFGALTHARHALFVCLSGYSAAVLVHDGRIHEGHGHPAGDIGSLPRYRWPDAIARAREAVWGGQERLPFVQDIIDRAAAGDPIAEAAVGGVGQALAPGVADLAVLWDPDTVVLTGQFVEAGRTFLDPLEEEIRRAIPSGLRLVTSTVDRNKGSCLGGVVRALDAIDWSL